MKRILQSLVFICLIQSANAQEPVAAAKNLLLHLVQHSKQTQIFKAFPQKSGTVYFYPGNSAPELEDLLFFFLKEDDSFRLKEDRPVQIPVAAFSHFRDLTDSTELHSATAYDIGVGVDALMQDPIFSYVLLRFRSVGPLAAFYRGYLFCKFDAAGNLLKYSVLER